jgi:hypothetical protein
MPERPPTAAQQEALSMICTYGPLGTTEIGERLVAARPPGGHPAYAHAIAEMAGVLAWRLSHRGLVSETAPDTWAITEHGRAVCPA